MMNRTAAVKSSPWIHDTYCRPPPTGPPSPRRAMRDSTSNTPPLPGAITIAARSATLRVAGTFASSSSRSHAWAMSTLNAQ
jgi:hypothetical protein